MMKICGAILLVTASCLVLAGCVLTPLSPGDNIGTDPLDDGTTPPFCQADGALCRTPPMVPSGFVVIPGTTISIPVSGQPPVTVQLTEAVESPGNGGICCGVVAVVDDEVTLYRAWAPHYDEITPKPPDYAATYQFGHWWSADRPDELTHQVYRIEEDICIAWNSLTVYTACTIRQGTHVFIGPGQSASCNDGASVLEASPALQIYVPNPVDPTTGRPHSGTQAVFDDCQTFVWPQRIENNN